MRQTITLLVNQPKKVDESSFQVISPLIARVTDPQAAPMQLFRTIPNMKRMLTSRHDISEGSALSIRNARRGMNASKKSAKDHNKDTSKGMPLSIPAPIKHPA